MANSSVPLPGLEDWLALGPELSVHGAVLVLVFVPCFAAVKKVWPEHEDPWTLTDSLVSTGIFPLMSYAAIRSSYELSGDVESRWRGTTWEGRQFIYLYLARTLLHIPVQFMQKMGKQQLFCMSVHHVLSIMCFGMGLATGRCHFWANLDGCCEMSTIFLNNLYLCREVKVGGRELREIVPHVLYAMNAFLLWISFLVFRLLLFPSWLYFWYKDVSEHPEATWRRSNVMEQYLNPVVTLVLLCLSVFWFGSLTKGLLKVLGVTRDKNGKDKEGKSE